MNGRQIVAIIAALFLSGCKFLPNPFSGIGVGTGVNKTYLGTPIYDFGGQSNSAFLAQHIGNTFLNGILVPNGIPSTPMSRWTVGGDLYNSMVIATSTTLKSNAPAYIAGLVFWQGESDGNQGPAVYNLWPQRFADMVADFRKHFGNVPVVFVQITDTGTPGRSDLRALQASISIPGVMMVPTDGIMLVGDHTDDAGYEVMAGRVADAMKKLQADEGGL